MKKGNLIILLLLLITTLSYGQNDFKEIEAKTMRMSNLMNNKAFKSKNIIKIYKDKIEISIDESKLVTKVLSKQNLDGIVTTFNVKEVDNGNAKIAIYKGDGTKFTIDYSSKKPKVKLEQTDPNTGDDIIITYQ